MQNCLKGGQGNDTVARYLLFKLRHLVWSTSCVYYTDVNTLYFLQSLTAAIGFFYSLDLHLKWQLLILVSIETLTTGDPRFSESLGKKIKLSILEFETLQAQFYTSLDLKAQFIWSNLLEFLGTLLEFLGWQTNSIMVCYGIYGVVN